MAAYAGAALLLFFALCATGLILSSVFRGKYASLAIACISGPSAPLSSWLRRLCVSQPEQISISIFGRSTVSELCLFISTHCRRFFSSQLAWFISPAVFLLRTTSPEMGSLLAATACCTSL